MPSFALVPSRTWGRSIRYIDDRLEEKHLCAGFWYGTHIVLIRNVDVVPGFPLEYLTGEPRLKGQAKPRTTLLHASNVLKCTRLMPWHPSRSEVALDYGFLAERLSCGLLRLLLVQGQTPPRKHHTPTRPDRTPYPEAGLGGATRVRTALNPAQHLHAGRNLARPEQLERRGLREDSRERKETRSTCQLRAPPRRSWPSCARRDRR